MNSIWKYLSGTSFLCGLFTFYKGIDKMTHYRNSDYATVNAYVGGDAYNYIINGTYATSFFVLTAMFILAAIGMLIIYYLNKNMQFITLSRREDGRPELSDELPDL